MIELRDTFNNRHISNHRTVLAAVKARRKHSRRVEKMNGKGSYLTYSIQRNGAPIDGDEMYAAEEALGF